MTRFEHFWQKCKIIRWTLVPAPGKKRHLRKKVPIRRRLKSAGAVVKGAGAAVFFAAPLVFRWHRLFYWRHRLLLGVFMPTPSYLCRRRLFLGGAACF